MKSSEFITESYNKGTGTQALRKLIAELGFKIGSVYSDKRKGARRVKATITDPVQRPDSRFHNYKPITEKDLPTQEQLDGLVARHFAGLDVHAAKIVMPRNKVRGQIHPYIAVSYRE